MNLFVHCSLAFFFLALGITTAIGDDNDATLAELNAYWAEVSRSVREGDFAGYQATCNQAGVLVSGEKQTSEPLSDALKRWRPGFDDTKAGKLKADVQFRFSQRIHDATTAHETGIFRYSTEEADGVKISQYIHFEGLLIKSDGKWTIVMEYQKSKARVEDWNAIE